MNEVENQEIPIQVPLKWKPSQYASTKSRWLVILAESLWCASSKTGHLDPSPSVKIFLWMKLYPEGSFSGTMLRRGCVWMNSGSG